MTAVLPLPQSHQGAGFNLPFKGIPAQAVLSSAYSKGHICAWNTNPGSLSLLDTHCAHQRHLSLPDGTAGSTSVCAGRIFLSRTLNPQYLVINKTSIKGTLGEKKSDARVEEEEGAKSTLPEHCHRLPKQECTALPALRNRHFSPNKWIKQCRSCCQR